MITIIDYGMGNLCSVQKAFEFIGAQAQITSDPQEVRGARALILPGVGAFGRAMENLKQRGLDRAILEEIGRGTPFLGICLGLQLLFEESQENFGGENPRGLGVLPGKILRFPLGLKVPQIGWNQLEMGEPSPLYHQVPSGSFVYFVHSYYLPSQASGVTASSQYGVEFAASVGRGTLQAIQFHPEKSSQVGLRILDNFLQMVR